MKKYEWVKGITYPYFFINWGSSAGSVGFSKKVVSSVIYSGYGYSDFCRTVRYILLVFDFKKSGIGFKTTVTQIKQEFDYGDTMKEVLNMEYRKYGDAYYLRVDKNEEIISCILDVCRRERIPSATFSGIGGCQSATIQTFIPEKGVFEPEQLSGMLELVSLTGNIVAGENGRQYHHTHASFAFKTGNEHKMAGGHLASATVLYTAEIELRPVLSGQIRREYDPETGTGFWDFA